MWTLMSPLLAVVLLLLADSSRTVLAAGKSGKTSPWLTLHGNEPSVIAKGGMSGVFPDSSEYAYSIAMQTSMPDVVLWCDVQLTKDGYGICLPDVKLSNCTVIGSVYANQTKTYDINGESVSGMFSVDYTLAQLSKVPLIQGLYSRTEKFDGVLPILTVDYLESLKPPGVWLNIQHDLFYTQHNLSMKNYLTSISRKSIINYVSSPEVEFLKSINPLFKKTKTNLIFRFLGSNLIEPSTKQTYGSLLKNLTFVKTFASGIIVPKDYIWPVTADLYLLPYTSVVLDAHKMGLQVFASDFANDALIAYNYSYDPVSEYLNFVDNGKFSVDGVLTDYPITASEAIGCFSQIDKTKPGAEKPLIISNNGASGVFPGCTDLAYKQAIEDGADIIDCPVQITKDGILVCLPSMDLMIGTTVTTSSFSTLSTIIPEIQNGAGIFSFNLTWADIQKNLKPMISSPDFSGYKLLRSPENKNAGNFMTLKDFLTFTKDKQLSGVLINIEHAAFQAENLGFSVTDSVLKELSDSGYDNRTSQEVMIQSANSSVLVAIKERSKYKLVYKIDELISDAISASIKDIKKFADSVAIMKESVFPKDLGFITSQTKLVEKLQSAELSVYVYLLSNEFVTQAWDFFSDPAVQINNYIQGASVDGIITDYPATASAYKKNTCLKDSPPPNYMLPVQPGGLLSLMAASALPPASAPFPSLKEADVLEPPLPPASLKSAGDNETQLRNSKSDGQASTMSMGMLILMLSLVLLV
ncbi:putative Glycerophosphoryl diester phosphodiesterase [Zostera marina]|uniref:glycerophosphodiester phosphodiesterase n=1 Tax=Zostera marina TaxID=29655 RepID=A0A0K9PJI7_ZOSMR|nr:putative Glycerophosphoryl diester phosphodiesterase [Zostera marina]